jgi:hypothetical protein
MKLYSARVRLAGEIKNEVNKVDLTAAEIIILQTIHGASENASDPVVDIKETGSVKRTDAQERARLEETYAGFHGEPGAKLIRGVLGVPGVPLPKEYESAQALEVEEYDATDEQPIPAVVAQAPIVRRRIKPEDKAVADAQEAFAG